MDDSLTSLRSELAGALAGPGDPQYDELRAPWNATARQEPALVVAPARVDDVAAAVRFAASRGWRVAVQATGHGAAGTIGGDVLLLNMRGLAGVEVDAGRCVAALGAGATWGAVAAAAEPAGLVGLAGTAPGVGVAGYTLHGGAGWLARACGLASASLLAVDYVDPEGAVRTCDEASDPDALWAFRGGAGVGVATRLTFRLFPHARFHGGARSWSLDDAPAVLERWLGWTSGLPESLTSMVTATHVPDLPAMPPPLRGRSIVTLGACGTDVEADRARVEELFAELPEPLVDTFGGRTATELGQILPAPPGPVPSGGDGRMLRRLDAGLATAIVRAAGLGDGPVMSVELRHLGGQAATSPAAGALTALPGEFLLDGIGATPSPDAMLTFTGVFDRVAAVAAPVALGRSVAGFRGGRVDAPGALDEASRARLRELRAARDPDGRLHRAREVAE